MKMLISHFFLALALMACGSTDTTATTETTANPATETETNATSTTLANTPSQPTIDYCSLLSAETASSHLACAEGIETASDLRSEGDGGKCIYRCTNDFKSITVAYTYNPAGFADVISRKADNQSLVTQELDGFDALYLMEAQGRYDAYLGNLAITMSLAIMEEGARQEAAEAILQEIKQGME